MPDRVTAALHAQVLARDLACFLFKLDPHHICADQWGRSHSPYDKGKLTVDHVKDEPQMGKRAPSDQWHLVAMCHRGNTGVPSRDVRRAERAYLMSLEGWSEAELRETYGR